MLPGLLNHSNGFFDGQTGVLTEFECQTQESYVTLRRALAEPIAITSQRTSSTLSKMSILACRMIRWHPAHVNLPKEFTDYHFTNIP
jgi:hypothetical protein